ERLFRHVRSPNIDLRNAALGILKRHPEWASLAADAAELWLKQLALSDQDRESLIGLVLAFQSDPKLQEFVAATMKRDGISTRVALLEAMGDMTLATFPVAWKDGIARALSDAHPEL